MRGLLLFAHGARDPQWAAPFQVVLERVRAQSAGPVELAFLEMMQPDLEGAIAALAGKGCTTICIVPLFLGEGAHLKRDLPALVEAARQRHGALHFEVSKVAGEAEPVLAALARYCLEQAGKPV